MFVKVTGIAFWVLLTLVSLTFGQAFWDTTSHHNPISGFAPPQSQMINFVCLYGIGSEQPDTFHAQPWHRSIWDTAHPSVPSFYKDVSQTRFTMTATPLFHNNGGVDYIFHNTLPTPPQTDWWTFATALVAVADPSIDFSQYCTNSPNVLTGIVIPYWGTSGTEGEMDVPTNDYWQGQQVWLRVVTYVLSGTPPICLEACAHEFGHSLGLPDVDHGGGWYDWYSLGSFDDMSCTGFYKSAPYDSNRCSFFNPQWRNEEGWLDFTTITEPQYRVPIHDLYTTGECFKLPNSNPKDALHHQYFLVTNHQKLGYYEAYWPGAGLMIWHVQDTPDTRWSGNWGNRRCHAIDIEASQGLYQWDLVNKHPLNADPIFGFDSIDVRGDNIFGYYPPYIQHPPGAGGAACLFPGPLNNTIFDGLSNPSSNLWDMSANDRPESLASHSAVYNIQQGGSNIVYADLLVNNWYGNITQNTTWGPNMHYVITGDVRVNSGVKLTIREGTTIDFYPHVNNQPGFYSESGIYVGSNAKLTAIGTPSQPVVFRSNASLIGGSPSNNDWRMIYLGQGSTDTLKYCQISDCYAGIHADNVAAVVCSCNTIQNAQTYGIKLTNVPSGIKVMRNRILSSSPTYGVYLERTNTATPTAWQIAYNYIEMGTYGIYVNADSMGSNIVTIYRDTLTYPLFAGGATAGVHLERTKAAVRIRRCRIIQGSGGNAGIECVNRVWPVIDSTKMASAVEGPLRSAYGIYIDNPNAPAAATTTNIRNDSIANFNTNVYVGTVTANPPRLGINNDPTFWGLNNIVSCGTWNVYYWGLNPPTMRAEANWWGSNPPNTGKFYPLALIDYTPYRTGSATQTWVCGEPGGGGAVQGAELVDPLLPTVFDLSQSYPNPANGELTIRYALPQEARVSLRVYNIAGQLIRSLVSCPMAAGYHSIRWEGKTESGYSAGPGVYFYRMDAGTFTSTKKLILAR